MEGREDRPDLGKRVYGVLAWGDRIPVRGADALARRHCPPRNSLGKGSGAYLVGLVSVDRLHNWIAARRNDQHGGQRAEFHPEVVSRNWSAFEGGAVSG